MRKEESAASFRMKRPAALFAPPHGIFVSPPQTDGTRYTRTRFLRGTRKNKSDVPDSAGIFGCAENTGTFNRSRRVRQIRQERRKRTTRIHRRTVQRRSLRRNIYAAQNTPRRRISGSKLLPQRTRTGGRLFPQAHCFRSEDENPCRMNSKELYG